MVLSPFAKTNLAVLIPEVTVAPVAAIGAVYCAANFAPHQMEWLTRIIADNIVQPNMKFFDSIGGSIRHAHEKYDREKREEAIKRGEPIPDVEKPATPKERAHTVASALLKGTIAIAGDYTATYFGQKYLGRKLGAPLPPHLASKETALHLVGIAALPTLFATTAENINYGISKKLRSTFGMEKGKAEDASAAYTYVTLPGQLAALLALTIAHGAKGIAK